MFRLSLLVLLLSALAPAFPQINLVEAWSPKPFNVTSSNFVNNELLCFTPESVPIPIVYPQEHDCWTVLRKLRDDRDFIHRKTYSYWPYPPRLPPGVKIDRKVPIIYESSTCVVQIDLAEKPGVQSLIIRDSYAMAMHVLNECIRKATAKHVLGGAGAFEGARGMVSIHGSLPRPSIATS